MKTNRDLYEFVVALPDRIGRPRSLEEYLRALYGLAVARKDEPSLPLADVCAVLELAFAAPAPPFDARWVDTRWPAGWEERLRGQVVDLVEMRAAGTLDDPQRGFGVNAPRGARWYNFDPLGYLECGAQGAFGGWEAEGDELRTLDPFGWDDLDRLLAMGQVYE